MPIPLETERLRLRAWQPEADAAQALEIYSDSLVTRFLSNGKVDTTLDEARSRLQFYTRFTDVGGWAIVEKATQEPVGSAFLIRLPDASGQRILDYEVGWHLRQRSWGKGYATEAAQTLMNYGFHVLKLPAIYAIVKPENQASIRVTQRLGMTPLGRTNRYHNAEVELFVREA